MRNALIVKVLLDADAMPNLEAIDVDLKSPFGDESGHGVNGAIPKPVHTVQVREVVEFVLRSGDLSAQRQFVGPDRALAGIRGHQKIQRSRPAGYQTEIPIEHTLDAGEFSLLRLRLPVPSLSVQAIINARMYLAAS